MSAESAGRRPVRHVSHLSEAPLGHARFSPRSPLNGSGRGLGGGGAPPSVTSFRFRSTNTSARAARIAALVPGQDRARSTPGRWRRSAGGDGVREARDSALGNRPQCPCNGGAWECPPAGLVGPVSVSVLPYQAPPAPSAPDPCPARLLEPHRSNSYRHLPGSSSTRGALPEGPEELRKRALRSPHSLCWGGV